MITFFQLFQILKRHPIMVNKTLKKWVQAETYRHMISGYELLLLLQRTWVGFRAPAWWITTVCSYSGSDALFCLHRNCTHMTLLVYLQNENKLF